MKKFGVKIGAAAVGVLVLTSLGTLTAFAKIEPKIQPNVSLEGILVGGLTRKEAAYKIRVWWQSQKVKPLKLVWLGHSETFPSMTPSQLDVTIDDIASVDQLPIQSPMMLAEHWVHQTPSAPANYQVLFKRAGIDPSSAYRQILSCLPKPRAAKVIYIPNKGLQKTPEIPAVQLDSAGILPAVSQAEINGTQTVDLPIQADKKLVTNADLAKITDFISSYTTHHPKLMYDRNQNIATAAETINGTVLLPGEEFSFNKVVGKRTTAKGYKQAMVFKDGKDSVGIGGGICQVSTTLYNTVLLGGLQIVERQNHSMPVGYIKLGRDATVDWGEIDFKFRNSSSAPIAICAQVHSGSLTFRIFGQAVPGQTIHIERSPIQVIPRTTEYVTSSKLPPGKQIVLMPGRTGLKIKTWRVVYLNGKQISKQYLGQSYYRMQPRVIERGPGNYAPIKPASNP